MLGQWRHSATPGVVEKYEHGHGDEAVITQKKRQDVGAILDRNRRIANETDGRTAEGGRFLGSIPNLVFYDWIAEWERQGLISPGAPGGMAPVNDLLKKKLRDSDYSKLRTTHGAI